MERAIKKIAVLPGDGIGPEIIEQAVKVAKAIEPKLSCALQFDYAEIGACAIRSCGEPYPDSTDKVCKEADAILFGAVGDPEFDNNPSAKVRPEQGLLKMRKSLGLFANIRPLKPYEELLDASPLKREVISGTDMVIIRELTGGIYFGEPRGRTEDGRKAFDSCIYSVEEIERIARIAFEYASRRRKKLTLVDKANVLATSRLWREVVTRIGKSDYPNVELDFMFVDNAAMKLVMAPAQLDVVLTENMFGDILSDMGGAIGGSIGLMPSASAGSRYALYEPIHGSFPQAKGKNIANPVATILSLAMLFEDSLGEPDAAKAVREACALSIKERICTPDIVPGSSCGTSQVGDFIASTALSILG